MTARQSWLCALVLALLAACGGSPTPVTQLIVTVDSDLKVPSEIDQVTIEVANGAKSDPASADLTKQAFPRSLSLVHDSGPLGPFVVKAIGYRAGVKIIEKDVQTSFVSGKTKRIEIKLEAQCKQLFCPNGSTCSAGECVPVGGNDTDASTPGDGDGGTPGNDAASGNGDAGPADGSAGDAATQDSGMDGSSPGTDSGTDGGAGATPVCTITLPVVGDTYSTHAPVPVSGGCTDQESGTLSNLQWSSDLSGPLSVDQNGNVTITTIGTHTLSLCAADPADSTVVGCATVVITMTSQDQPAASIDSVLQNDASTQPFVVGTDILLAGTGTGAGVTLTWIDNLQGNLGSATTATLSTPVEGHHLVTLNVLDRNNRTAVASVDFVVRLPGQSSLVTAFTAENQDLAGAGSASVTTLASDKKYVYAGTAQDTVYRFDPTSTDTAGTNIVGPLGGVVQSIFIASNAYLATSAGLTVCPYVLATGGINGALCSTYTTGNSGTNDMRSVVRMRGLDNTDHLVVGTSQGVGVADSVSGGTGGGSFKASWNSDSSSLEIRGMAAYAGLLWLATNDGLYRYDPANDRLRQMATDGSPSSSLTSIAVGTDGMVWVGSDNGLGRFDPSQAKWTGSWGTAQGLADNQVNAVAVEHVTTGGGHDILWLGTAGGVSRFDPTIPAFMTLTATDGLPSPIVHAINVLSDGTKVFATDQGLARYQGP